MLLGGRLCNATASYARLPAAQVHLLALTCRGAAGAIYTNWPPRLRRCASAWAMTQTAAPRALAGSDDSSQSADAAGHSGSEAGALDEPRARPDVRALARRLAALEGALGGLAAAQERAHGQVSAGLACVAQQLDSLQVRPPRLRASCSTMAALTASC